MVWQFMFGCLVIVNIGSTLLSKVAANVFRKKEIGVFFQYLFSFLLAILYFGFSYFVQEKEVVVIAVLMVAGVGIFNALGNLAQWEAYALSLSKSALLDPLIAIIPMALGLLILQEITYWNLLTTVGIAFCLVAIFLFGFGGREEEKKLLNRKWFFYATAMVIIQGMTAFVMKVFSFTISREDFLIGWYGGSCLTMVVFLFLKNKGNVSVLRNELVQIPRKRIFLTLFLSMTIVGSLFFLYWTYQLNGPVSIVNPLLATLITVAGILLGWFFFKERKRLSKSEWTGFILGLVGAVLIFWK